MNIVDRFADFDRFYKAALLGVEDITKEDRETIKRMKQDIAEAKQQLRGYVYAQTRIEQLDAARKLHKNLRQTEQALVSLVTIFGPADVAHLSAILEDIRSQCS